MDPIDEEAVPIFENGITTRVAKPSSNFQFRLIFNDFDFSSLSLPEKYCLCVFSKEMMLGKKSGVSEGRLEGSQKDKEQLTRLELFLPPV